MKGHGYMIIDRRPPYKVFQFSVSQKQQLKPDQYSWCYSSQQTNMQEQESEFMDYCSSHTCSVTPNTECLTSSLGDIK
jgi:hypothetical protein